MITWRSSGSKSAAVYKISSKSDRMIFHWYMAIYRFSKWRPFAILELFYNHTRQTTKSLLLAAAACQISCQSDTQIWRYSYLNFSHIWLEMPIQASIWRFLGDFRPLNVISHHRDPQKAHFLRKSALFKLSTVKIRWGVWPVGELTESVTDTQVNLYSVHALHSIGQTKTKTDHMNCFV